MSPSARSILVGIANAVALFMVIGVIAHGYMDEVKPSGANAVSMVEPEASIPSVAGTARNLGKGKGKGKGETIECIDLDATPAPTKGKGKGGKMSKTSKGKGSSSEAPVSVVRDGSLCHPKGTSVQRILPSTSSHNVLF